MSRKSHVLPPLRRSTICLALGLCLLNHGVLANENEIGKKATLAARVMLDAGVPGETFDSFIVYYRSDAAPGDDAAKAARDTQQMLEKDLLRANSRLSLKATQERRLATGGHLLRLPDALSKSAAADFMLELASNPQIEAVEPNALRYSSATPNDPQFPRQWAMREAAGGLNIQPAWDHALGNGVVIAILDTGQTGHPDLDSKTLPGYDFISDPTRARDGNGRDDNPADMGTWSFAGDCGPNSETRDSSWHGTHVAGIAAAATNNGIGIAGAAPGAAIQHVRVLGRCGGTTADVAEAMIWASGGRVSGVPLNPTPARVLNLSLGGYGSGCSLTEQRAIDSARSRRAVVVVAAGNNASPASGGSPSGCNGVISVAATNRAGKRASYSNYGLNIDVAAPGGEGGGQDAIWSTLNAGTRGPGAANYGGMSGTSMAAPYVAGIAALLLERRPSFTPTQIETLLRDTARPFPGDCTGGCGAGIVDAREALRVARGGTISRYPVSVALYGNGSGKVVSTPARIDCGTSCSDRFNKGVSVTLRATAASGFEFSGWSGACAGASRTCTLAMHEAKTAFATFKIPVKTLKNGSVRNNLVASGNTKLMYRLTVPAGASALEFRISGGRGDADLYVRRGSEPSLSTYDCRPWLRGNNESCTFDAPMAGDYFVMLSGDPDFSGVRLSASFTSAPLGGALLSRNTPLRNIAIPEGGARYYRFRVPTDSGHLRLETRGSNGDLDLYVRRSGVPTTSSFTCASLRESSNEICEWQAPVAGTYYLMLHGFTQVSGVTLTASYVATKQLTLGWSGAGAGSVRIRRVSNAELAATCGVLPCDVPLPDASFDLMATAATGSSFAGWVASQCDSITAQGHCRIRMNQARNITARFTLPINSSPVLTLNRTGSGMGTVRIERVAGSTLVGTCLRYPCRVALPAKATYELSASSDASSIFGGWLVGQCDSITMEGRCRVRIEQPTTLTARFSPK